MPSLRATSASSGAAPRISSSSDATASSGGSASSRSRWAGIGGGGRSSSAARPSTASTVASYTSATTNSVDSDASGLTAKRLQHLEPSVPSSSSSGRRAGSGSAGSGSQASSGGGGSGASRIGKPFETLLASDETWVLSETAHVARDEQDHRRELEARGIKSLVDEAAAARPGSRGSRGSGTSSTSAARRIVAAMPVSSRSRWEEREELDDVSPPASPRFSTASSSVAGAYRRAAAAQAAAAANEPVPRLSTDSMASSTDATPTLQSTPRMKQGSSSSAATLSTPAPPRPPRAVERSPSASTRNSVASGRKYATPPEGGASPASSQSDLPIHPLSPRTAARQQQQQQQAASQPAPASPTTQRLAQAARNRTQTARPPAPPPKEDRAAGVTQSALEGRTASPAVPFPRSSSKSSDAQLETKAFAISPPPNGSVSLAQEVAMNSPDPNADKSGSGTFFSQRMKKTSGFLRKLRGGDAASGSSGSSSSKGASKDGKSAAKLAPPGQIRRQASHSSFVSDGGHSVAASTHSVPGSSSPAMTSEQFKARGAVEEPVPVIPSQWANQKGAKSPARRKGKEQQVGLGLPPLPALKDHARAGSTPVVSTGRAAQDVAQRSATYELAGAEDSAGATVARTPSQTHVRKSDSAAGGSNSSGSELRHTIRAWETEMDETLGQSAQDLDAKTHIAAPPPSWTPSPRLPSIEGLGPQRGRQRSFMEDEEERLRSSESYDTQDAASQDATTPRFDGGMQQQQRAGLVAQRSWSGATRSQPEPYTRTAREQARSNPPLSGSSLSEPRPSSLPGLEHSLGTPGTSTYDFTRDSMVSAAHNSSGHLSRAESASARSDRTFETAVDPGSIFLRRAESRASSAALTAASGPGTASASNSMRTMPVELAPISVRRPSAASAHGPAEDEAEEIGESMDPEMSIRLVPRRPSLDEPPTPTDAVPPAPAARASGHARDVSDLGPLPLPNPTRRGSRASTSSAPTRTASPGLGAGASRPGQTSSELGSDMDDAGAEEKAREFAARCWAEDESVVKKEKIAESLGGLGRMRQLSRTLYMANFDFTGLRIDSAFRKLCDKLFLRAETQQVDRILHAFSERFWACNPTPLYSSADVVHSLVFSILLLNTDLHVADITDRMTRNQFVRNTLSAIIDHYGATARPGTGNATADDSQSAFSVRLDGAETKDTTASLAAPSSLRRRGSRAGSMASSHGASTPGASTTNLVSSPASAARDRVMRAPSSSSDGAVRTYSRAWEVELEGLLKEIYAAVKSDQIRLPVADAPEAVSALLAGSQRRMPKSGNTLSVGSDRVNALKRGSIRGIQGLLGSSANTMRSDENLSLTPSSVGSRSYGGDSWLGQQTPASSALSSPSSQMAPLTLGFANTLSHSIIKETQDENDDNASLRSVPEIGDDELALMGSPWAKEGVLTRKHYWEGPQKRARDKNWTQLFVVVQKGQLSMFRFGDTSSSSTVGRSNAAVGGGNWLNNATALGNISLAHTLANALPPPGYNRARPHVFALTLANGAVFFFQAGHEELVQEWVSTCNYWAARQSREPLAGGVSNMEYGWNKVMPRTVYDDDDVEAGMEELSVDSQAVASIHSASGPPDASIYAPSSARKMSMDTRSIRSGRSARSMRSRTANAFRDWTDSPSGATASSASVYSTPTARAGGASSVLSTGGGQVHANERMYINDWRAPNPPTTASTLKEEEQLDAVARHIVRIEAELEEHNNLRQPMLLLYSPRGSNRVRAEANWTAKSSHLLGELTKWNVYADSLRSAAKLRADKAAEREVEQALVRADREMSHVRESEEGPPMPL